MRYLLSDLIKHSSYHQVVANGKLSPDGKHIEWDGKIEGLQPIKLSWPGWALKLSEFKNETDHGVGDTAERVFGIFGGELFKKSLSSIGIDCGCDMRKDDWNNRFPYALTT